jgi:tetratricopeptide (TPR) repeat protein
MGFRVFNHHEELLRKQSQREQLMQKQEYWRGIVQKYPDYKDAYYQLAVFSYELGEVADAREAVEHALKIDPNDENGNRLLAKIRG